MHTYSIPARQTQVNFETDVKTQIEIQIISQASNIRADTENVTHKLILK